MGDRLTVNGSTLIRGDARNVLAMLPEGSVRCAVTSPPYFGLRNYLIDPSIWGGDPACHHAWGDEHQIVHSGGTGRSGLQRDGRSESARYRGQQRVVTASTVIGSTGSFCPRCQAWLGRLGNEPTLDAYVAHLVEVFRAVRRVLSADGLIFVVLGDSYFSGASNSSRTRSGLDAPLYGSVGKAPEDFEDRDFPTSDLCDECRVVLPDGIARSSSQPARGSDACAGAPIPVRTLLADSSPDTVDSENRRLSGRSGRATRAQQRSRGRVAGRPLAIQASTPSGRLRAGK